MNSLQCSRHSEFKQQFGICLDDKCGSKRLLCQMCYFLGEHKKHDKLIIDEFIQSDDNYVLSMFDGLYLQYLQMQNNDNGGFNYKKQKCYNWLDGMLDDVKQKVQDGLQNKMNRMKDVIDNQQKQIFHEIDRIRDRMLDYLCASINTVDNDVLYQQMVDQLNNVGDDINHIQQFVTTYNQQKQMVNRSCEDEFIIQQINEIEQQMISQMDDDLVECMNRKVEQDTRKLMAQIQKASDINYNEVKYNLNVRQDFKDINCECLLVRCNDSNKIQQSCQMIQQYHGQSRMYKLNVHEINSSQQFDEFQQQIYSMDESWKIFSWIEFLQFEYSDYPSTDLQQTMKSVSKQITNLRYLYLFCDELDSQTLNTLIEIINRNGQIEQIYIICQQASFSKYMMEQLHKVLRELKQLNYVNFRANNKVVISTNDKKKNRFKDSLIQMLF